MRQSREIHFDSERLNHAVVCRRTLRRAARCFGGRNSITVSASSRNARMRAASESHSWLFFRPATEIHASTITASASNSALSGGRSSDVLGSIFGGMTPFRGRKYDENLNGYGEPVVAAADLARRHKSLTAM